MAVQKKFVGANRDPFLARGPYTLESMHVNINRMVQERNAVDEAIVARGNGAAAGAYPRGRGIWGMCQHPP